LFPHDLADDQKIDDQLEKFTSKQGKDRSYYGVELEDLQQKANKAIDNLYDYLIKSGCLQRH